MEFLIALFMIAGLVWTVPIIQSGRLFVIAMLVLGVGTVFGPAFFSIDALIQISLDRMILFGMLGMAIVGLRLGYAKVPALNRLDWFVMGMVGWFLTSAILGGPKPTGTPPVARWLFYIAIPAGMYVFARLTDVRARDVRLMLAGSIVLGIYLAVTAVFEITGMHGFVFPSYIPDPTKWQFYGRGRGPLLNPAGNGIVMSISLVAAAIGFVYSGRRGKLIYAVAATVIFCGVYATLTRSAWLGAIGALAILALIYSPRWVRVLGMATVVIIGGASVSGVKDQLIRMKT